MIWKANRFIIILPSLNGCSLSYVVTVSVVSTGTNSVCTAADEIILSTAAEDADALTDDFSVFDDDTSAEETAVDPAFVTEAAADEWLAVVDKTAAAFSAVGEVTGSVISSMMLLLSGNVLMNLAESLRCQIQNAAAAAPLDPPGMPGLGPGAQPHRQAGRTEPGPAGNPDEHDTAAKSHIGG